MAYWPAPWQAQWQHQPQPDEITGVRRVKGMEGARACSAPPGSRVMLMDSDDDVFYIVGTGYDGVSTVDAFRFERMEPDAPAEYVTRDEFNRLVEMLGGME